jgi:hypothetical protein
MSKMVEIGKWIRELTGRMIKTGLVKNDTTNWKDD